AEKMRFAHVPRDRLGGPPKVVAARLSEAPESEDERPDDDAEKTDQEERPRTARREVLRNEAPERDRRPHDEDEKHDARERLGSDHGALEGARLTSLSSMTIRLFLALA